MNYYEHHLGDYLRDTAHLSMLEDGAYRRLLDAYYIKELPIPAALKEAYRLVRGVSKPERDAVQAVLREFFEETPEGWRHKRCDAEIERFRESEPDREAKRENERERQKRTRERRRQLFDALRERGVVPRYDMPMTELQALVSRVTSQQIERDNVTPVTRDATATHTPDTTTHTQTPDITPGDNTHPDPEFTRVSMAGAICATLKAEGVGSCNPGHPDLAVLIAQGAEVQNFVSAARTAVGKGKGFAYVLGIVKGQLAEARQLAAAGRTTTSPHLGSSGGAARAARMAEARGSTRPDQGEFIDTEARDVTP